MDSTRRASLVAMAAWLAACGGGDDPFKPERRLYGYAYTDIVQAPTAIEVGGGWFMTSATIGESTWADVETGQRRVTWMASPVFRWVSGGSPPATPAVRKAWIARGERFISTSDARVSDGVAVLVFENADLPFAQPDVMTMEVETEGRVSLLRAVPLMWVTIG